MSTSTFGQSINIRALNKISDLAAFKEIRMECINDSPESFRATPQEMAKNTNEDFENQLSGNGKGDFFAGAFDGEVLIGVAAFYHEQFAKLAHKGMIGSVYVKRNYRNRGVGRKLMHHIIDKVKEAGSIKAINLSVITSNKPAIKLYKDLGFIEYGTEPNAVRVGGQYYDELLMQYTL